MSWSIDTCQNKVSANKYHVTLSWTQVLALISSLVVDDRGGEDREPGFEVAITIHTVIIYVTHSH